MASGDVTVARTCNECGEEKPIEDFPYNSSGTGSRRPKCRVCVLRRSRESASRSGGYSERYEQYGREWHYKNKYGITPAEYAGLLLLQGGVCKVCGRDGGGKKLRVDHNHATGEVRGLLCKPCNTAIGLLQEDLAVLRAAIDYLKGSEV